MAVTGAYSYAQYGKEETKYGTEASTIASAFGKGLRITPRALNNMIVTRGIGSRNAASIVAGRFDGILEIEFTLGTSHWLAAVIGAAASTSSNPYIHTFSEANDIPSITIENGVDLTTDSVRKYLGCKINTCEITATVGEPVRVRLEVLYKTETEGTTLDATPATDSESPFIFAHGDLEIPNATDVTKVQSFVLRINNNLIQTLGIGSRFVQASTPGNREYTFELTKAFEDATQLERFYGGATTPVAAPAETATLELNFTNGLADANERHIYFTGTGVQFDEHSDPQDVGDRIDEIIRGIIRSGEFVGEDNTATTIFD